jgi:hypothetical protein
MSIKRLADDWNLDLIGNGCGLGDGQGIYTCGFCIDGLIVQVLFCDFQ